MSVNTPKDLVAKAIAKFTEEPAEVTIEYGPEPFGLTVIKRMELRPHPQDQSLPPDGDFYAYVWNSEGEMRALKAVLGDLAKIGLVVAVSKPVYASMKSQDARKARIIVKEFTRHNDKLGFDYSVPNSGYYVSKSRQFQQSQYPNFLKDASLFYTQKSMPNNAAHFTDMIGHFNMDAGQGIKADFAVPTDIQESRLIQGYMRQIEQMDLELRKSQDTLDDMERENRQNKDTIQGYQNSVVLSPHQVIDFPQQLRTNVRKMVDQLQTNDEKRYIKSLLDPFHPDVLGVRVPTRVPRNTITYNTHSVFDFKATASSQDILFFNNFEQMSGYNYVALSGSCVQKFLTNTPVDMHDVQVHDQLDDQIYDITVVAIGNKADLTMQYEKNDTWNTNFFKLRCVAGGTRVLKTSKQDAESGSLDLIYSRDGSSFDEGHSFKTDLARSRPDRVRTYLQGSGCCLRETNGFIIQANKRPHDEHSLDLQDVKKSTHSSNNFAPRGHTSTIWLVDMVTAIMYEPRNLVAIPANAELGIVLESLQQRHTTVAIVQDLQPGMAISFETIYHLEGIADQTAYGFTQASSAKLRSASTALQLLDQVPVEMIFAPYSVRRPELLEMIMGDRRVRGFWDETLFPMIQDMVKYGADTLSDSDFLDDIIDAVVDAAAGTLGYAAPEFLPAIMAAASEVRDPLHNLASDTLQAASQWAERKDRQSKSKPYELAIMGKPAYSPVMIDTCQPSYGDDVTKLP